MSKFMRASEAARIFVGGGTMTRSLTWAFSLADKEDEEGRHRGHCFWSIAQLSSCLSPD